MADGEEAGFRGLVEHVASGRSERFRSVDELVSFLRAPGRIADREAVGDEA